MYNKKARFIQFKEILSKEQDDIIFLVMSDMTVLETDLIRSELHLCSCSKINILKRTILEKNLDIDLKKFTKNKLKLGILRSKNLALIINKLSEFKKINFFKIADLNDPNYFKISAHTKEEYIARIVFFIKQKLSVIINIISFKIKNI